MIRETYACFYRKSLKRVKGYMCMLKKQYQPLNDEDFSPSCMSLHPNDVEFPNAEFIGCIIQIRVSGTN